MDLNSSITGPVSYLRDEYEHHQALFNAQPVIVQHFIEAQAQRLANALVNNSERVAITLPDRVVDRTPQSGEMAAMLVPAELREQTIGGWRLRFEKHSFLDTARQSLSKLEQSPDQAVNASVSLLRFATANHLVHNMLPAGRSVKYSAGVDEQIPTIPVQTDDEQGSAITSAGDAIVEQGNPQNGRGDLLVPFVPAARRFYLPQWVAFDEKGSLLVNSVSEAEAYLLSMQRYVSILHISSSLAPYMLADEEYQRKRYGILGQVINQGRALAQYKARQIVQTIQDRVAKGTLNRGLRITLPYFHDQDLCMAETDLDVIPAGRVSFKPIFVVRAVSLEYAKVAQDTRLNSSTRKYLLKELEMLEQVFLKSSPIQTVR